MHAVEVVRSQFSAYLKGLLVLSVFAFGGLRKELYICCISRGTSSYFSILRNKQCERPVIKLLSQLRIVQSTEQKFIRKHPFV